MRSALWALTLLLPAVALADFRAGPKPLSADVNYQFNQPTRLDVGSGVTRVSVENGAASPLAGSYLLRLEVDNRAGPAQLLSVSLHGTGGGSGTSRVSRTVELSAGERRALVVPVPVSLRYGVFEVRGATVVGTTTLYFNPVPDEQHLLLSLGEPQEFEAFVGHPPTYGAPEATVISVPSTDAPTELAAYVGYEGVVVPTARAWESLSDAQRRALETYAAAGGTLSVHGPVSGTDFPLLRGKAREHQYYGLGTLSVRGPGPLPASALVDTEALVSPQGRAQEWERRAGVPNSQLLPQASAPLGRFLLIIALFTFAIGPGSVWVSRRRGPSALLFTIPATAFVTCALIVGYSLVSDGFTVHGATYGYTLIDRVSKRALTHGVTGYYANLAPSRATFSNSVAVLGPWARNRESNDAELEWRGGQQFGGDFVPSRTYREWGFVAVEPTRARVSLKRSGDSWVVQNALGLKVDRLFLNVDGVIYATDALADGAEGTLSAVPWQAEAPGPADSRFTTLVQGKVAHWALEPGQYVAHLSGQGFVPSGGLSLQLHDSQHVVRGEVEP